MGLRTGFALLVVAVQDVVPVAEPRFGDRAVARYADPVLNIAYTVGRYLEGYLHGFRTLALDRSRDESAVVCVVEARRNLQLDAVLLEFVVAVLVALDLCLVKIPVIENSFRVVLGIDRVESVVLIGMR